MVVQEKISGSQLGFMLIPLVIATAILSVPSIMTGFAKQDAWLSVIPASLTGVWSVLVITALAKRYPGMTIVEYSSMIIGKWGSKLLALYISFIFYLFIIIIAREHANFIDMVALPRTPSIIEIAIFMTLCGMTVLAGIEVIGRLNQFLVPPLILFLLPLFILSIPDMEPARLQPVLGEGIMPVWKGAIVPAGWTGEVFVLGFLLPFLNSRKEGRKVSLLAVGMNGLILIFININTILVMGGISAKLTYPMFEVIRYISVAEFLERMDPLIVSAWTMGIFMKESIFMFVFSVCVSQLFGLRNYRIIVMPLTVLSIIGERWVFKNTGELQQFLLFTFPPVAFLTHNLLPTVLLLTDSIRNRKQRET